MTAIRSIHLVGIAGVGMSALAVFCHEKGIKVTGSDDGKEYPTWKTLQAAKISWQHGFLASNVPKDCDLVVVTNAHDGFTTNPETQAARQMGKPVYSLRQAIAKFARGCKVIAVAGTHGKTTTASMIATILTRAGLDPSWLPIGTASIPTLPANGHAGKSEWLITEADEYFDRPKELGGKPNFLYFSPTIAVVTSVDWDHPDVYPTEKHYRNAFKKFIKQVPSNGLIVANGDSGVLRTLAKAARAHVWWYGTKRVWPNLSLKVIGEHNRLNATAAARVAHEVGVTQAQIRSALATFSGSERRLEQKGAWRGVTIIDDYAHHPVEIRATIAAIQGEYPGRRMVVAFQPHTFSRTAALLPDFGRAFGGADIVFLLDIWGSAREKAGTITSERLAKEIEKNHTPVEYMPGSLALVASRLRRFLKSGDLLLTMGATDIYLLHNLILHGHN